MSRDSWLPPRFLDWNYHFYLFYFVGFPQWESLRGPGGQKGLAPRGGNQYAHCSSSTGEIFDQIYLTEIIFLLLQAGLVNRKLGFNTWTWEEEVIVLTLEYFVFPFTILVRKKHTWNFFIHSIVFKKFRIIVLLSFWSFWCFLKWTLSLRPLFLRGEYSWEKNIRKLN